MDELTPRVKLWLEKDGQLVFSEYRARLLRLIKETGSLAEAAQAMSLSYRRAWGKLREIETNLGEPLVHSARGGGGGGRSGLTARGERMLMEFEALAEKTRQAAGAERDSTQDERERR